MNKKLICLTLSILMLLACFLTSCSGNKKTDDSADTDDVQDNSAKTITMWLIGEELEVVQKEKSDGTMETLEEAQTRTAEEQKKARDEVNRKFTAMTKSKFKTNVILKFCTEEEYYEKLEEAIGENQKEIELEELCRKMLKKYISDNKKSGKDKATLTEEFYAAHPEFERFKPAEEAEGEEDAPESDVYIENDDGVKEIKYPDEKANQVDIFYVGNAMDKEGNKISGYDKYMEYYNSEWLSSLSEELSTSSKKLTSYISTSLLNGVQVEGGVYAIPNNVPIGEYTYMFIDKQLFDAYYHKIANVTNVTDLGIFLNDVMYENQGKNPTDPDYIVPLAATFEECIKMLTWYWDIDYVDHSVYETYTVPEDDQSGTGGRTYVLQTKYTIKGEAGEDSDKAPTKDCYANVAVDNMIYKVNALGQFLDAEGNVLPYKYAVDNDGYWTRNDDGDMEYKTLKDARALYLVDENGVPVTPENDKRVVLAAEYTEENSVYETHYDSKTGRIYVLKVEEKDGDKTAIVDSKIDGQVYKMNAQGQFIDYNGNVMNFGYEYDTEGYWFKDASGKVSYIQQENSDAMYLVELPEEGSDEEAKPVKSSADKRVTLPVEIAEVETKADDYGNIRPTYMYFVNEDVDFSILGTMITDPSLRNRGSINLAFTSLFTNKEYRDLYATLKEYEYKGFYGEPAEGQKAAVSFVKGDAKILQDYNKAMEDVRNGVKDEEGNPVKGYVYEDGRAYYVVVAEYPMATEDELYGNMYAVYANSPNLSRAMKVITYLNTNKEMRDLLQYGVEDIHYERNDNGTVTLLSDNPDYGTYRMKMERTGNCFIATPEESMGPDAWTYAKIQNNDSLVNPLLGFDFNTATADSDYNLDVRLIDYIKSLNADAMQQISDCNSKESLVLLMTDADNGFMNIYTAAGASNKDKMNKALNFSYDPSSPGGENAEVTLLPDMDGSSPYTVYYEWLTEYKYLPTAGAAD